jgi:arsenate reductase-like glutaredoxin family protein
LEDRGIEIVEQVSASKKLGEAEAEKLIQEAETVHVAKGKKLEVLAGGEATPEIVSRLLGATGNLRAPTIKAGKQLLVGFNEETYSKVLE